MTKPNWIIYYSDGATFSELDGPPEAAPFRRIDCIGDRGNGWTLHNSEWYWWNGISGCWESSDTNGILYHLVKHKDVVRVIRQGALGSQSQQRSIWLAFKARTDG